MGNAMLVGSTSLAQYPSFDLITTCSFITYCLALLSGKLLGKLSKTKPGILAVSIL
ncbi:hypothetical protein KHA80_12670 [Anaerobacillus sp. HL2]|nr:hypothetical protein KHA80_12670 [Anaerobacillus sp. HL2]